MSGPILFVENAPQFQDVGGLFIVTLTSGDSVQQYAMPRHAMRAFAERARLELNEIEAKERLYQPVPFVRGKRK